MWLLFAMMMTAAGCILPSMTTGGRKGGRLLPLGQPRYDERFRGMSVPRPRFWGGYALRPEEMEFWQGQVARLHDRFLYTRGPEGWRMARLAP